MAIVIDDCYSNRYPHKIRLFDRAVLLLSGLKSDKLAETYSIDARYSISNTSDVAQIGYSLTNYMSGVNCRTEL